MFEKNEELINYAEVFTEKESSPDVIFDNGVCFLLALYKAPGKEVSIDSYRYLTFAKSTQLRKPVEL